ncbi:MAG TPA: hypothetical protein DCS93_11440 [Microscillaceae bacterium]|nr:hypothetical protein [Microscillaceae bacterium]
MKHCKTFLCLVFTFWLIPTLSMAQVDSLENIVSSSSSSDSLKAEALNELAWIFQNKDLEKAMIYATDAVKLALGSNIQRSLATAHCRKGLVYQNKGIFDSAKYHYKQALAIEKKLKYPYGISRALNYLGLVYMNNKKYQKAIDTFKECISILKENNLHSKIATKKINLGICYKNLGKFEAAIQSHLEAIDIYKKSKNTGQIGKSYLGLGVLYQRTNHYTASLDYLQQALVTFQKRNNKSFLVKTYHELGFLYTKIRDYDKAVSSYNKSLSLLDEIKSTQNIQVTYNNLGLVYLEQSKFGEAKKWLNASLDIAKEKRDTSTLALVYNNLGRIQYEKGNNQQAIDYYNTSLSFSEKIIEKYNRRQVLANLSIVYAKLDKYEQALTYYRQFNQANDSLEKSFREAMVLKDQYLKEKQAKELELTRLKEVSYRQKLFNIFLGITTVLLLITLVIGIIGYKTRQKARQRKLQIDELLSEQEFIALSKMLQGQEQERDRIAQDLHDRLGSMLSMVQLHFGALKDEPQVAQVQQMPQYQKATQLLDNACDQVRKVAHDISSNMLRRFGLIPALFDLKENVEGSNSLKISIIDNGFDDQRLPANYEIQIYRVIQEMVSNVLKHAEAQNLEIQLLWTENNLHISVEDNGKGFNVKRRREQGGMGLSGIESRVRGLGGECTIDSTEGIGTAMMIDIPMSE